ncbi:MAG: glycosyltransferase family 4 protein [Chitinophagales bacterium]
MVRVSIVSTFDVSGGAAMAAWRLVEALQKNIDEIDVRYLTRDITVNNPTLARAKPSFFFRQKQYLRFLYERWQVYQQIASRKQLFLFSTANVGENISSFPAIQQADIIHLHWINQGFVSIDGLKKLLQTEKPIVWTLHDMWTFTGGCHYSDMCFNYEHSCGNCHLLRNPQSEDLSAQIWEKKWAVLGNTPQIHYVTCSKWLAKCAQNSSLLRNASVSSIPNPIDTGQYFPVENKGVLRTELHLPKEKKLLLFGAMSWSDPRKGFVYFKEAITHFLQKRPDLAANCALVVVGESKQKLPELGIETHHLGFVSKWETMLKIYQAVDVYVIASLEENLPNTIMEAMSCGIPSVGFITGGIPEMIQHTQNGYLATLYDAEQMADGIAYVLEDDARYRQLSAAARTHVVQNYTPKVVAAQYWQLYQQVLHTKD